MSDIPAPTGVAGSEPTESPLGRVEAAAFLASGAALVVHILVDVPLWISVALALGAATAVIVVAARRHPQGVGEGRRVVAIGFRSAVLALVAYDTTRLLLSWGLDFQVQPFGAFRHFGAGLLGTDPTGATAVTWGAGTAFHVVNGITFGVAYTIAAGRRGVVAGTLFGLGLEAVMLGLYPAWLQIPNLREFTTMSLLGHVAYGATLGYFAQRGMALSDHGHGADQGASLDASGGSGQPSPSGRATGREGEGVT